MSFEKLQRAVKGFEEWCQSQEMHSCFASGFFFTQLKILAPRKCFSSFFILSLLRLWSVGGNDVGQLGRGDSSQGSFTIYPVPPPTSSKFVQVINDTLGIEDHYTKCSYIYHNHKDVKSRGLMCSHISRGRG